jgi:hypothetical protein
MWTTRAFEGSQNEIAKQVTETVITTLDPDELVAHGWIKKPFRFSRDAMALVVDAVEHDLLEWDVDRGLGVLGKFSATPEWLAIPRRKTVP